MPPGVLAAGIRELAGAGLRRFAQYPSIAVGLAQGRLATIGSGVPRQRVGDEFPSGRRYDRILGQIGPRFGYQLIANPPLAVTLLKWDGREPLCPAWLEGAKTAAAGDAGGAVASGFLPQTRAKGEFQPGYPAPGKKI